MGLDGGDVTDNERRQIYRPVFIYYFAGVSGELRLRTANSHVYTRPSSASVAEMGDDQQPDKTEIC